MTVLRRWNGTAWEDLGQVTSPSLLIDKTASPSSLSGIGFIVQGVASQSADLQQWQNSAGTKVAGVSASGTVSGTNLGDGLVDVVTLGAADMKNNFTYANTTADYPQFIKRNGVVHMNGRVRQTAGFTGGSAWNVPTSMLPDSNYATYIPVLAAAFNAGSASGPPIVANFNPSTNDISFTLLSGGTPTWSSGTWIPVSATWHALTP